MPGKRRRRNLGARIAAAGGRAAPPSFKNARFRNRNMRSGGFLGIERKFEDKERTAVATVAVWAGGELDPATEDCLSGVAQGDGEQERDGRRYVIQSVHIRGRLILPSLKAQTSPAGDVFVRLALVWDKQTNGAKLNAEDVFKAPATGTQSTMAMRNLQYTGRFKVLKDKRIKLDVSKAIVSDGTANSFSWGQIEVPFEWNVHFKRPIAVLCSAGGSTVASVTDNSLHLVGCSDNTTCTIEYESRIRFEG